MNRFMAEKGLLERIVQVSDTVTDRASDLVMTSMGFLGVPYRRGGNTAESGFDYHLVKPVNMEQLLDLLSGLT